MNVVKKILWSVFITLSSLFTARFVEKGLKTISPFNKKDGCNDGTNDTTEDAQTTDATETETPEETPAAEEASDGESK